MPRNANFIGKLRIKLIWYKAKDMLTSVHARIRHIREDAHHNAAVNLCPAQP